MAQKPAVPAPSQEQHRAGGLAGAIRIGNIKPVQPEPSHLPEELHPLSQESLEHYWNETAEELDLHNILNNATVHLTDQPGRIEIEATTVGFADDFKPHRIAVMESIRKKSGMPLLDCKVKPLFIQKEDVPYSPTEKYAAMIKLNPHLADLRKLFPQIDY